MLKLNLVHPEKSDIDYSISRFPDGEVQITIGKFDRKHPITVGCRITSAEELFILMQVIDILERQEVVYSLEIFYLMGMRMDRVMDFSRPFTLKIVGDILHNCKANKIVFTEIHSNRIYKLYPQDYRFRDPSKINYFSLLVNRIDEEEALNTETFQIVFPDEGAYERYGNMINTHSFNKHSAIKCKKVRDLETGKIQSIEVLNPQLLDGRPLLIIDDLCDAGGTFIGVAEALRKHTDVLMDIFVIHMVNPKGIENLSKTYRRVWFTNSYKDWENLPENCTQIEII